ncbi:FMN-binding negative transcriptional regulator [Cellulomonas sp. C5510]|uniref:FMN-binding negative transcriptional regulator n=1 Tax=Cellulomonas sp. C5510 TaxID=2871170 RepID=UPI001C9720D2|nr:FMN-binding negative transcriptional regulator [Cellulomonas sp. C5510]QZN85258.1 FMN-binding negative transcriptional regulator [Cellulomonas sp. C5510]
MGHVIHTQDYVLTDEARVRDLVREHGWATLVSATADGPVASHVPILLEEGAPGEDPGARRDAAADGVEPAEPADPADPQPAAPRRSGRHARALPDRFTVPAAPLSVLSHLGRPDEQLHEVDGTREHLLVVEGPYGYVSPGWYGYAPAVPTWNYVAVHLYGTLELLGPEESYAVMGATVDRYEAPMPDPVRMPDVEGYARRIAPGAVGFRMRVTRWQGKAKLSQDKPREVAERVAAALEDDPHYANPGLAAAMRAELGRRPSRRPDQG